jgi:hypothetical protein
MNSLLERARIMIKPLFSIPFDVQRHIKRGCLMDVNAPEPKGIRYGRRQHLGRRRRKLVYASMFTFVNL